MVIVKATKDSEAGVMPTEQLLREMGNFNEELVKAGVMLAGEGLHPTSKGARVRFSGSQRTVIDGPFAETKELIAGYWLWECPSLAAAIEWVKRCPHPHPGNETEIEIRPVFSPEDFGAEFTPELREQEERLLAGAAENAKSQPSTAVDEQKVFINLPVKDLDKSIEFFAKLGYTFNPQFTNENATCMIISEDIYAMLLVEKFFATFTPKKIIDAKSNVESLTALNCKSRAAVNEIVEKAFAAGGKKYNEPQDHGFMYQWGFEDLDGHIWEHFWMDPSCVQK
jgi:predicted lactoylglutathione lyase